MPRPPSRTSSSAAVPANNAQIASSNQTLNSFLGGTGTKSWMQTAQDAPPASNLGVKKPTVRPARSQRPQHNPAGKQDTVASEPRVHPTTDHSILPSPALTNEPSPAGSTRHVSPNALTTTEQQATSKAPSRNDNVGAEAASTASDSRDVLHIPRTHASEQPDQTSSESSGVLAQPSKTTSVHPDQASRRTPDLVTQSSAAPLEDVDSRPGSLSGQAEVITRPHPRSVSSDQPKRSREPEGGDLSPGGQEWKRSRITQETRDGNASSEETQQTTVSKLDSYVQAVERRIRDSGGWAEIPVEIEQPRYRYLLDACSRNDGFYVILHQVFCLWSLDKTLVHQTFATFSSMSGSLVDRAFEILMQVLRPNTSMVAGHLAWFAAFPSSMRNELSLLHRNAMVPVGNFLKAIVGNWMHLVADTQKRGYPATAYDMIHVLNCHSSLLRGVLFTVSRRTLGIHDKRAGDLNIIFGRDDSNELNIALGRVQNPARVRSELVMRYKSLVSQALRRTTNDGSDRNSPMVPSPAPAAQGRSSPNQAPATAQPAQSVPAQSVPAQLPQAQSDGHRVSNFQSSSPQNHRIPWNYQVREQHALYQQPGRVSSMPLPQQPPSQHQGGAFSPTPAHLRLASHAQPNFQQQSSHLANPHDAFTGYERLHPGTWSGEQIPVGNTHAWGYSYHSSTPGPSNPNLGPWPGGQVPSRSTREPSQALDDSTGLPYPPSYPSYHPQLSGQISPLRPHQGQFFSPSASPRPVRNSYAPMVQQFQQMGRSRPVRRIPENEWPMSPHDWTSVEAAAHLPQLRSPQRRPAEGVSGPHFQYVARFSIEPTVVEPRNGLRRMEFLLSADELARVSKKVVGLAGVPLRYYFEGSCRYRLRFCRRPGNEATVAESDWAVCPTYWPEEVYINVNNQALMVPRKQHFHHDLPLELSDILVEGENTITISLPGNSCNLQRDATYFMAVEVVTTASYGFLKRVIQLREHATSRETELEIRRRLQPADTEDVIVEDKSLFISLADPFSSVMFHTPVRGVACKHVECFDLDNWLSTRRGKPSHEKSLEPCTVDCWKCPICGLDARPKSLRIIDYFANVRASLLATGKDKTKKIEIVADGTWTAVEEPEDPEDEAEPTPGRLHQEPRRSSSNTASAAVIEILDD